MARGESGYQQESVGAHVSGLKAMKCPNCGASISVSDAGKIAFSCPSCHVTIVNEDNKFVRDFKADRIPRRYIDFSFGKDTLENAVVQALVREEYVPMDIFDRISIKEVKSYFLPMIHFEGDYHVRGAGRVTHIERDRQGNTRTSYESVTVRAEGEYSLLCCACINAPIPKEIIDYCRTCALGEKDEIKVNISREISLDSIMQSEADLSALDPELIDDADTVWYRTAEGVVKKRAKDAITAEAGRMNAQLSSSSTDIMPSYRNSNVYVLVPFWHVSYSYNGSNYYYVTDGLGSSCNYSVPSDSGLKSIVSHCNVVAGFSFVGCVAFAILKFSMLDTVVGMTEYLSIIFLFVVVFIAAMVKRESFLGACKEIRQKRASTL